jgi:hypothetical protein
MKYTLEEEQVNLVMRNIKATTILSLVAIIAIAGAVASM